MGVGAGGITLGVVISTKDRPADIGACLGSLLPDVAGRADVVVVDQSSGIATEKVVAELEVSSRVRYMRCPVRGVDVSRNTGVSATDSDVILFVDDDCRVLPGWYAAWESVMASSGEVAIAFGTVLPGKKESAGAWLPWFEPPSSHPLSGTRLFLRHGEGIGMGANMAIRRTAWFAVSGFDEALGAGAPLRAAGEIDFAYRATRAGWRVIQTRPPRVVHYGLRTGPDAARLAEGYLFGAGAMYMKNIRCGDAWAALLLGRALAVQSFRIVRHLVTGKRPLAARSIPWYLIGAFRSFAYPVDRATKHYVLTAR